MQQEFLESAEFYRRRYHNFSSRVIVPTAMLIIFILVFSLLATKEMTISSMGTVEPTRIVGNIQSTNNQPIVSNKLDENKLVQEGEVLIEYQASDNAVAKESLDKQLARLKEQKAQLDLLKESIDSGSSKFTVEDQFGYAQIFQDYLSQVNTLTSNAKQQNATIASQNASTLNQQAEIGNLIEETSRKMGDYQNLKIALQSGQTVDVDNAGYALFQTYQQQTARLKEESEKEVVKTQVLEQVENQIAQLESSLSAYRVQYAGSGVQQAYSDSLNSQVASLKSQTLTKVSQDKASVEGQIAEIEAKSKLQANLASKDKILAKEAGLIHLNPEVKGSRQVPEGTIIAQVYPDLTTEKEVKIVTYLSSRDIAKIQKGDKIRLVIQSDTKHDLTLESKVTNIATTATKTKSGNYFRLESKIKLTEKQAQTLKYGSEGKVLLTTGKKTYFQYYLDEFLGDK